MTNREKTIWTLDQREMKANIPARRGILARCYGSLYYRGSPYYRRPLTGRGRDEPTDRELSHALTL